MCQDDHFAIRNGDGIDADIFTGITDGLIHSGVNLTNNLVDHFGWNG